MTIEGALAQRVKASGDFSQLAGDHLYPVLLPENHCSSPSMPASATYQLISTRPLYTLDGRIDFTESRIQFDAWARFYPDSKMLMAAIIEALDDYSDHLPSGMRIYGVQLITSSDQYESDARFYRASADFKVQFSL